MVQEHSSKFASQLQLYTSLFAAFSAAGNTPPPQGRRRRQLEEARENLLAVLADTVPEQNMSEFAKKLQGARNVRGLCSIIGQEMDTGTPVDVLLSRMSFVDVIEVIEQFQSVPEGADAGTPCLRRGVLRMKLFERACVTYLQNRQKVLDALEAAAKVPLLKNTLGAFTSRNNVTPADILEAPSKFLHGVLSCLNDLAMLDGDGAEEYDQMVDVAYAAFKQFVIFYDRMDELLRNKNRISQFALLEDIPFNKERVRIVEPGRRVLYQENVTFIGACDTKMRQGKVRFQTGGRLRRCDTKYVLYVFSDMLMFVDSKDRAFVWPLSEVNVCEHAMANAAETDEGKFVLQDKLNGLFSHFECKRKSDVASLVARVHTALVTHRQNTVFGKRLSDVTSDANLSSDGVPRFVAHAIAWILANDMQAEGPFRQSARTQNVESELVVIDHNLFPCYAHHEPEAVLKRWLCQLPGRLVRFTAEWEAAAASRDAPARLAELLNARVPPPERRIFALMVALAHCIVRHTATTRLDFTTVSTVMAQNVFFISERDVQKYTVCANQVFRSILVHSDTPEKFRAMFASLFVEPAFSAESSLSFSGILGTNALGTSAIGTSAIGTNALGTSAVGDPAGLTTSTIGVRRAVRDPYNALRRSRKALVRAPPAVCVPKLNSPAPPAAAADAAAAAGAPATPTDDAPLSPVPLRKNTGFSDPDEDDDDYDDDDDGDEELRVVV